MDKQHYGLASKLAEWKENVEAVSLCGPVSLIPNDAHILGVLLIQGLV